MRDIGRCTAELVWRWGEIEEQIVFTAGETVSYRQLAETVRTVSGREIKVQEWTVPFLEEELEKDPKIRSRSIESSLLRGREWRGRKTPPSTRKEGFRPCHLRKEWRSTSAHKRNDILYSICWHLPFKQAVSEY